MPQKRSHHAQKYYGQPGHRGNAVERCSYLELREKLSESERETEKERVERSEKHKLKKADNRINLSSCTPVPKALRAKQVRLRPVLKVPLQGD